MDTLIHTPTQQEHWNGIITVIVALRILRLNRRKRIEYIFHSLGVTSWSITKTKREKNEERSEKGGMEGRKEGIKRGRKKEGRKRGKEEAGKKE